MDETQRAAAIGCTVEQLRAGYRRNVVSLGAMLEKAERTGRKVNGFTAEQLRARIAEFKLRADGKL